MTLQEVSELHAAIEDAIHGVFLAEEACGPRASDPATETYEQYLRRELYNVRVQLGSIQHRTKNIKVDQPAG